MDDPMNFKSYYVKLDKQFGKTKQRAYLAKVNPGFNVFFCFACDTLDGCIHSLAVRNHLAGGNSVYGIVREDTNNPYAIKALERRLEGMEITIRNNSATEDEWFAKLEKACGYVRKSKRENKPDKPARTITSTDMIEL
jgi:hypothetical protein